MGEADVCSDGSSHHVHVPSVLYVCFSGQFRYEIWGECVFHFALKVIHLFWTSFFEAWSGCRLRWQPVQRTGHEFYNQTDLDLNPSSVAFQGCCLRAQFPSL